MTKVKRLSEQIDQVFGICRGTRPEFDLGRLTQVDGHGLLNQFWYDLFQDALIGILIQMIESKLHRYITGHGVEPLIESIERQKNIECMQVIEYVPIDFIRQIGKGRRF